MPTMLKLGPKDHGRELTDEEFLTSRYSNGAKYELIDGRLFVSPVPDFSHDWVEKFLYRKLLAYSVVAPQVTNYVTNRSRVIVPSAERTTWPEPDMAAFKDVPLDEMPNVNWIDISPFVVGEVMGGSDDTKDLVRNAKLFLMVPSILEYWVLDIRDDPARPTLLVHRRRGDAWRLQTIAAGGTYTTRILPGFRLVVDPRS